MRIIVLGLPHTKTSRDFSHCAFTQKAFNLCKMMYDRGHEVIHIGVEGGNPPCIENVSCMPESEWAAIYGDKKSTEFFDIKTDDEIHKTYMDKFAVEMRKAIIENTGENYSSIVAVPWGGAQQIAVQGVPQFIIESGIGYKHVWANYRVYESYAWMHFHFGLQNRFEGDRWYDVVIPNSFDTELFEYNSDKDDYLLYLGRLNEDKGVRLAIEVAALTGHKIKLAGQGDPSRYGVHSHVEYVGPVGVDERKKLLSGAKALMCPTRYIGPFEGTAVEAMLSGTPVITTDWGVFPETVLHGITGYRCRTLEQFEWAVNNIKNISSETCWKWASTNYSLERVGAMYEEYFGQVLAVKHDGWPSKNPGRKNLDWLVRDYGDNIIDISSNPVPIRRGVVKTEWEVAQAWEREWWGTKPSSKWEDEKRKQDTYARLMGMPVDLDFGDKTILDIGCGPVSMLLRSKHGTSTGVDPMPLSDGVLSTFRESNVEFLCMKAEDMSIDKVYDELWCYNCLQHVENLKPIFEKMNVVAKEIRLFEWIDLKPCPGHPQILTYDMFISAFPSTKWDYKICNTGTLHGFGGTALDKYIALHLIKK